MDLPSINDVVVNLTETDERLSTSGQLDAEDRYVALNDVAGDKGYGKFTVGSDGAWSYRADTAHNEFAAGSTYSDKVTFTRTDCTQNYILVNIKGTNDGAVISTPPVTLLED